ncbi:hypothetical protein FSP39_016952 [Pinctada imbricata]|uniref:Uncharacterized protein n=1 Tax=Pinctada imbricata TaxID=66713 RepID=A0AA88XIJ9_PINIB|nr:hypothetical protein FSP39_016952 [Pinctada imbricata]
MMTIIVITILQRWKLRSQDATIKLKVSRASPTRIDLLQRSMRKRRVDIRCDVSSNSTCGEFLHLLPGVNNTYDVRAMAAAKYGTMFSQGHLRCLLEFHTGNDKLILANIRYNPKVKRCNHGYISIGNDKLRVGEETMTSFKFCNSVWNLEIVSRGNYLWIVYDHDVRYIPSYAEVEVVAMKKETCNSTSFHCSPVQCIPTSKLCDGKIDCDNRRDEYCVSGDSTKGKDVSESPCFMCADGNCINPVQPIYSLDRDKPLNYICDGFRHCLDGTDERKDMCYRTKSKVADLLRCIPVDKRLRDLKEVLMWQDKRCDGVQDCLNNEDEQNCEPAARKEIPQTAVQTDSSAIIIIACATGLLLLWIVFFTFRTGSRCQKSRSGSSSEPVTSRNRIIRSHEYKDYAEVSRLQPVSEDPEELKWT